MVWLPLIIFTAGLLLFFVAHSSTVAWISLLSSGLLAVLVFFLQRYLAGTSNLSTLVFADAGAAFAQEAPTGRKGEVLTNYTGYKRARKKLFASVAAILLLALALAASLKIVPVPAVVLIAPALALAIAVLVFAGISFFRALPPGRRLRAAKNLIGTDPRRAFAAYAPKDAQGALTVGYTTYKRLYRATAIISVITLGILAYSLTSELFVGRLNAEANLKAAARQFQATANALRSGQGDIKKELMKLAAQSLQPAPTLDESSLSSRVLASVLKNLPEAPVTIVPRDTVVEKTVIVEKSIIESLTKEVITVEAGGKLVFEDENGVAFITFDGSPQVTVESGGVFDIKGEFQIDEARVTATAEDLNITSKLDNTTLDDEGARYIGVRAATYNTFTPERNDLEAALRAIDSSISSVDFQFTLAGDTGTSQTISSNSTMQILTDTHLTATAGFPDTVTVSLDGDTIDGTELADTLTLDAALAINTSGNGITFNEDGADSDFRIEGDADANVFFVDASTSMIGIGDASPDDLLNIHSASAASGLAITSLGTDTDSYIKFELLDSTPTFIIGVDDSDSDKFKISTTALGTSDRLVIDSNGNVGVGTGSPTGSFHVKATAASGNVAARLESQAGFDANFYIMENGTDEWLFQHDSSDGSRLKIWELDGSDTVVMTLQNDGNVGIGDPSPTALLTIGSGDLVTINSTGQVNAGTSGDGLVTKVVAGACSDANFTTDTNGLICIDSTNGRIYFRYSNAWHYAAQTAGFQIPNYEAEGLEVGDYVVGHINQRLSDGALHGVYVGLDDIIANELEKHVGSQSSAALEDVEALQEKMKMLEEKLHGITNEAEVAPAEQQEE